VKEPVWLGVIVVLAIHASQIREHGGSTGLRDEGLLESAPERARNRFHHEPAADLASLAASYGFGLARNHPFSDGNKRVAFQAMYVFLALNGLRIHAEEPEVVRLMLSLAAGDLAEEDVAVWLRQHTIPR
jgi:death-on-curing protein